MTAKGGEKNILDYWEVNQENVKKKLTGCTVTFLFQVAPCVSKLTSLLLSGRVLPVANRPQRLLYSGSNGGAA